MPTDRRRQREGRGRIDRHTELKVTQRLIERKKQRESE